MASYCPVELLPKMCVGTSMGAVLLTSLAGAVKHWRLGHVSGGVWLRLSIGALVGSFAGGYIVRCLPADILKTIIGAVLILTALRMALSKKTGDGERQEDAPWWLVSMGIGIGVLASTVGIGGGILAVPLLIGLLGMRTKRAAGTSSAMTAVLSAGAIAGLMLWGGSVPGRPEGCIGFVSIGNALMIGVPGAIGAVLGAGLHEKIEPGIFKIVFVLFLIVVGLRIIIF